MSVKLFHAFVSAVSDGSNAQVVRPSNWNAALQYGNAGGAPSGTDAAVAEILSANRTYYVRTDGNDSNTGLVNNSGGAFLTVGKAIDVVSSIDVNGFDVTIQIGNGTYTITTALTTGDYFGNTNSPRGPEILGDAGTPSNVVITSSVATIFDCQRAKPWYINGVKMSTTVAGASGVCVLSRGAGLVFIGAVEFGSADNRHVMASYGGQIRFVTSYTISAGSQSHVFSFMGGRVFYASFPSYAAMTVTLTGTPAFSQAFAYSYGLSFIESFNITFSGSATGSRYISDYNALIQTYGGGASYFPGDAAGATANGGVYA